jgi:hypothetical protein
MATVAALLLFATGSALSETTKTIRMRVVDSATKAPIPGASVTYYAEAREGTLTGHGGKTVKLFEIQTQSAPDGAITLQPASFNARPFGLFGMNTNYESPTVVVSKAGYKKWIRHQSISGNSMEELVRWDASEAIAQLQWIGIDPARDADEARLAASKERAKSGIPLPDFRPTRQKMEVRSAPQSGSNIGVADQPQNQP